MRVSRAPVRRKSEISKFRLGLVFAVIFVFGYGFYVQTKDFHPQSGFRKHRKELRELSQQVQEATERIHSKAEALRAANRLASVDTSLAPSFPPPVTLEQVEDAAVSFALDAAQKLEEMGGLRDREAAFGKLQVAESKERGSNIMQTLVEQQELRIDSGQEGKAGFQPLPPLEEAAATGGQGWRREAGADSATSETEWLERQEAVLKATQETWAVYEKYAMGADELRPLTKTGKVAFGDLGATLVDSLDTLWMLGLRDEFDRARNWVAQHLNFEKPAKLSLFETTIRIVGGLLSAYDLSDDRMFLGKATVLVDMLMPVFNGSATGIPNNIVYINKNGNHSVRASQLGRAAIAEFGSLQVEFVALSQRTSNATYGETAEQIVRKLDQNFPDKGLMPVWFNRRLGRPSGSNLYTVGAMADSYYEYLLKLWLLHHKQEEMYRAMWERATDEALDRLVAISAGGLTFVGERRGGGRLVGKMEHLACYFPGNLALGVAQGAVSGAKAARYLDVAANLTYTCWQMYERTATGLGMDVAMFDEKGELQPKGASNMLRPETVEALFYMWRVTGEGKYREWGWRIFEAFRTHSRTPEGAFACVKDVNKVPVEQQDGMESFWLAETLKYLWLLFGPDSLLSLDEWVLNTEAHPLRLALPTT